MGGGPAAHPIVRNRINRHRPASGCVLYRYTGNLLFTNENPSKSRMFSKKKSASEDKKAGETPLTTIAKGEVLVGDFVFEGDVRIEGQVLGRLVCRSRLVIGTSGRVRGLIDTHNAVIAGELDGKVSVRDVLHLESTATLTGDVCTRKLMIEQGAVFTGNCRMGDEAEAYLQKTAVPDLLTSAKDRMEKELQMYLSEPSMPATAPSEEPGLAPASLEPASAMLDGGLDVRSPRPEKEVVQESKHLSSDSRKNMLKSS